MHEARAEREDAAEDSCHVPDGLATDDLRERTAENGAEAKSQDVGGDREEGYGAGNVEVGHELVVGGADDRGADGSRTGVSFLEFDTDEKAIKKHRDFKPASQQLSCI